MTNQVSENMLNKRLKTYGIVAAATTIAGSQATAAIISFTGAPTFPTGPSQFISWNMLTGAVSTTTTVSGAQFKAQYNSGFYYSNASLSVRQLAIYTQTSNARIQDSSFYSATNLTTTDLITSLGLGAYSNIGHLARYSSTYYGGSATNYPGNFQSPTTGFVGLHFGAGLLGWASISTFGNGTMSLNGFGYEDSGGSILAGATGGAPGPGGGVPEPSTLSMSLLLMGAGGLMAFRKRLKKIAEDVQADKTTP